MPQMRVLHLWDRLKMVGTFKEHHKYFSAHISEPDYISHHHPVLRISTFDLAFFFSIFWLFHSLGGL